MNPPLWRRGTAEALGTGLLVTVVVGSGIAAASLSKGDIGLQLLENAFATALGLTVLILALGTVSGAHFNPVVSLIDWWLGQGSGTGTSARDLAVYIPAQIIGGIGGAILANLMFGRAAVSWSTTDRSAGHLWLAEVVATSGLILLIFALAWTGRANVAPAAVGAYIGSAYWFTSSTSFANPAVTIGRAFSDTFAGSHRARSSPSSPSRSSAESSAPDSSLCSTQTPAAQPATSSPRTPTPPELPRDQTHRAVRLRPQRRPLPDGRSTT